MATAEHPLVAYRAEFPVFERAIYLNTCSLGALARRVRAAVESQLDVWEQRGASAWYDVWWQALADLRAAYGRLIGAGAHEVSLQPNITAALAVVAESLDYSRRNRVVVTELDFPTMAYQWLAKRASGVELVILPSPDGVTVPLERFARAVDDRTALVATSHVGFTTGAIQDVAALASLTRRHGAKLLVDGYQAAGQIPVDVKALGVDFYCGGGLKWLLGGSGVAFLYARETLHRELAPRVSGWFAHRDQFRFDPSHLAYHDDARRLELGTPALAPVYAQLAGLALLEEIGPAAVRAVTAALAEDLIAEAEARGLRPRVAPRREDRSAIVLLPQADPAAAVRRLAAAGIIADMRPGHVRLSPYFYNVRADHHTALELLTP